MTVEKLIELLQKYPMDMEVEYAYKRNDPSVEITDIYIDNTPEHWDYPIVVIY